jgi:hypothetical protein
MTVVKGFITLGPGVDATTFFFVIDAPDLEVTVFVPGIPFQPSLIYEAPIVEEPLELAEVLFPGMFSLA